MRRCTIFIFIQEILKTDIVNSIQGIERKTHYAEWNE